MTTGTAAAEYLISTPHVFTNTVQPGQDWEHDYVYVHEFGHCFGGLADEYYSSDVSYIDMYPKGIEPWEPNITRATTLNKLKWKNLGDTRRTNSNSMGEGGVR